MLAIRGRSSSGSGGRRFTATSPARTAASVVQIWSIAADTCANLQAPWRTHKLLILLGFRCPVVPGRVPEGPLSGLLIRRSGVRDPDGPPMESEGDRKSVV